MSTVEDALRIAQAINRPCHLQMDWPAAFDGVEILVEMPKRVVDDGSVPGLHGPFQVPTALAARIRADCCTVLDELYRWVDPKVPKRQKCVRNANPKLNDIEHPVAISLASFFRHLEETIKTTFDELRIALNERNIKAGPEVTKAEVDVFSGVVEAVLDMLLGYVIEREGLPDNVSLDGVRLEVAEGTPFWVDEDGDTQIDNASQTSKLIRGIVNSKRSRHVAR
jgi:hypothetical protein